MFEVNLNGSSESFGTKKNKVSKFQPRGNETKFRNSYSKYGEVWMGRETKTKWNEYLKSKRKEELITRTDLRKDEVNLAKTGQLSLIDLEMKTLNIETENNCLQNNRSEQSFKDEKELNKHSSIGIETQSTKNAETLKEQSQVLDDIEVLSVRRLTLVNNFLDSFDSAEDSENHWTATTASQETALDPSIKIQKEFEAARRSLKTNLVLILAFVLANLFLLLPSKTWQAYWTVLIFSVQKGAMPILTTATNFGLVKNMFSFYWKLLLKVGHKQQS